MSEENENICLTNEIIAEARECHSPEEIQALAEKHDYHMDEEEAKALYAHLNPENGEIADSELDNVSGGRCSGTPPKCCGVEMEGHYRGNKYKPTTYRNFIYWECPVCGKKNYDY